MLDESRATKPLESSPPIPFTRVFGQTVQKFRFLPESYLASLGTHWDPGLDQLVYLRIFVEDETEDALR
jgi:hypothetical protein